MESNLTYAEASKLLGIKLATLYSLVARRRIPHIKLGPRLVRFPKEELLKWLEDNLVMPVRQKSKQENNSVDCPL
jgi:excisionase family DNA binding protein